MRMKKIILAVLAAVALLFASALSGYAARGSASVGANVRVGQATWGGPPGRGGHSPGGGGHPPSGAWGGHHGGGSRFFFGGSVVLGPWWPWYPWYSSYPYYSYYPSYPYYPYYYPAPSAAVQQQPPVYTEPAPSQSEYYWYYCQNPQGYYPYVKSCPGGWMKVVPQATPPQ